MQRSTKKITAQAETVGSNVPMRLTAASWLSDNALLLVGSRARGLDRVTSASFVRGDLVVELRVSRWMQLSSKKPGMESPVQWLTVAHGHGCLRGTSGFELALSVEDKTLHVDASSVALALTDLRTLSRSQFTALESRERGLI